MAPKEPPSGKEEIMIEVRHSKTNETIPVASTLKLGRGTKLGGHTIS